MAPKKVQPDIKKLHLCAQLAEFGYSSGNPELRCDDMWTKWPPGYELTNREKFYSHSWFVTPDQQGWFFKSHAYKCKLKDKSKVDNVNRIVVGFRGTWLHERSSSAAQPSGLISRLFGPSNYGLADLAYDATLIRVPYREGVVWKWFTYWGTLILEGSNKFRGILSGPRKTAVGLISRPDGNHVENENNRLVHLGFWALWASPEGFAGYDRDGHLWMEQKMRELAKKEMPVYPSETTRQGILQSVLCDVQQARDENKKTELYIVGHSLGGAVSCFAALDIVSELNEKFPDADVDVFHATFGAPPVGNKLFADYFKDKMTPVPTHFSKIKSQSWAIIHERDFVPKCFAFGGSKWWISWLGWWDDWNRAGQERVIRRQSPRIAATTPASNKPLWRTVLGKLFTPDGLKAIVIGIGTVTFLVISSLSIVVSPVVWGICLLRDRDYYKIQKNPSKNWKVVDKKQQNTAWPGPEDANLKNVGFTYHSLQNYIELLESADPFGPDDNALENVHGRMTDLERN